MNAIRLAVAFGFASLFAGAAFFACGGSDTVVDANDAAADRASSQTQDPGGGDNNGIGGGSNTGTGGDAGRDGGGGSVVLTSDPNKLHCGAATCDTATQSCCYRSDGGDSCITGTACAVRATCDEKADCPTNQVCCGDLATVRTADGGRHVDGVQSACERRCPRGSEQLCKTNAECPDGSPCQAFTCRGRTFAACGGFGDAAALCN